MLPLPNHRSLAESDLKSVRFDVALRGYRMAQVDRALRRTAYDVDRALTELEAVGFPPFADLFPGALRGTTTADEATAHFESQRGA